MTVHIGSEPPSSEDVDDEITRCRDLVVLIFRAVLHREPAESDAAAFTDAVLRGMPIYDFVSELMSTPEFQRPATPVPDGPLPVLPSPAAADALPKLMRLSLGLLQARLIDKGCQFQLGPVPDDFAGRAHDGTRIERLVRTLAMLDGL